MSYQEPRVIAEIGCNHKGEFELARDLVRMAKDCGAYSVKFQKRHAKELLTPEQYNAPHPNPAYSYGKTYGEHREFLEFNLEQHRDLKKYCDSLGIVYSTSVWDLTSAREIASLNPEYVKIPSACNNHEKLLAYLADEYKGEIHISTGMTKTCEIEEVVKLFETKGVAKDRVVLYACTSGYPVPFEDICLLEISKLKAAYEKRVKDIAFSGHHLGIAVDVAAYTLGARYIERHFTKDRTWKGTDHAASLEPAGLQKLCRDLKATYRALNFKAQEILPIEEVQREKLKYRSR